MRRQDSQQRLFLGVFTGGSESEWVCLHTKGQSVAQKSVVKRSSVTHYTPGDPIMTAWWGNKCFVVQYACAGGKNTETGRRENFQTAWGTVWDEKVTRTTSRALWKYTGRLFLPCTLINLNTAWCDTSGWQGSSHLYALSLLSVQQLQKSHRHVTQW